MDHKPIHDQAWLREIQTWENEGGALAQKAVTAFTINRITARGTDNFWHALDGNPPAQLLPAS